MFNSLLTPYSLGRRFSVKFLAAGQLVILLGLWFAAPASSGIPDPIAILSAWNTLALNNALLTELYTSTIVIWQAIILSGLIAMITAYLTTSDIFKPVGTFIASMRFLGFAGLTYLFTLWTSSNGSLKLALLTFGMTVFLTRATIDRVNAIPQSDIDYARSLGLSGFGLTWELGVRGTLADMLEMIRQNAAVGWTLLAMVEGITRSEGGIGALLLNQNKTFNLESVFAIQITILAYGILQDYALKYIRSVACPYADLNRSDL